MYLWNIVRNYPFFFFSWAEQALVLGDPQLHICVSYIIYHWYFFFYSIALPSKSDVIQIWFFSLPLSSVLCPLSSFHHFIIVDHLVVCLFHFIFYFGITSFIWLLKASRPRPRPITTNWICWADVTYLLVC